jgi:superfamily II DNA/RNA helicase
MNHLWFIRKRDRRKGHERTISQRQTDELISGDKLNQRFRYEANRPRLSAVGIMHGIVFGDGYFYKEKNHCRIHLCGESRELKVFFVDGHLYEYERDDQTIITGLPSDWKELPRQTNDEYLSGFLAGWLAADMTLGGNVSLSNIHRGNLEYVRNFIAPRLGLDVSDVYLKHKAGRYGSYDNSSDCYGIRFYQHSFPKCLLLNTRHGKFSKASYKVYWTVVSCQPTGIIEDVWCLKEPSTKTFVLSDGIVTHNCVQSRVFEHYDKDQNGLIASATSSGKTTVAEMVLSHEMRVRGGKGLYLVPMRALAQEKIDEWTDPNHHFNDKKISICTGDYRLTRERAKELAEADLIIMTSEMLNHRARNYKAEQNNWLKDVGSCVIDELHLLTVPGRGPHLEVGLMKFTEINPKVRLTGLSATMPNVEDIAEWISYSLTKKDTFCLRSKFRPCPLNIHFETYYDGYKRYDDVEAEKVAKALDIIEYYENDKFLVFAHTKRTGELMKNSLRLAGIKAEFHNAGLEKKDRVALENRFRKDKEPRVVVATPTLAWGCNLPARRVIVLGVHRGLDEVETYNITQMVGRSGRVGLDPQGDAYILLPESKLDYHKSRLKSPQKIESQLLSKTGEHHKELAFHLVSEIHHGGIKDMDDVRHWYKRSLAYFQDNELDETVADKTIELLRNCGAIRVKSGVYDV